MSYDPTIGCEIEDTTNLGRGRKPSPTLDPLDQDRAWIREAIIDERDDILLKALQVLDTLALIRDRISEVASSDHLPVRHSRTGSASDHAEDAISTAKLLWRSVKLIHTDVHGHIPQADRILAVARLTRLIVRSVAVTAPDGKRRAETEKTIDSILDGREARAEALVRREALRMASKTFALLTSPQRRALQEAWSPKTPDKKPLQKGWKLAQRFSRSVTSLNLLRRKNAPGTSANYLYDNDEHKLAGMEGKAQPSKSQESLERPRRRGVAAQKKRRRHLAEVPSDVTPPVRNDEQKDTQSRLCRHSADPKPMRSQRVHDNPSSETFTQHDSNAGGSTHVMYFPPAQLDDIVDLSFLGTWADESAGTPPESRNRAEVAEPEHGVLAKTTWLDDMNPDIVDNLLAEWTTLPR